jgi:hypothetical protein
MSNLHEILHPDSEISRASVVEVAEKAEEEL